VSGATFPIGTTTVTCSATDDRRKPNVDAVLFTGVGEWNGQAGYDFRVFAMDSGEPRRHREWVRITLWDPAGSVVASVEGEAEHLDCHDCDA